MTVFDRVFRGVVVTSDQIIAAGHVACRGETIAGFGEGPGPSADEVVDFGTAMIFPGIVDGHMHTSIYGWQGIAGATRSAAAGGITTLIDMPYDTPSAVTSASVLRDKLEVVQRDAYVDMALYGTVSKAIDPDGIVGLARAGISAFKLSTYEVNPTRFPRFTPLDLLRAFGEIARTGLPVAIHNEDEELVDALVAEAVARGATGPAQHGATRPGLAETLADLEIFEIGLETGAHVHIAHSSVARGFDIAAWYRSQGGNATAETCVHYLTLDEDDLVRLGGYGKCNPPLRSRQEVEHIWDRLRNGQVAYISSDHAPHAHSRKRSPNIFENASGLTGLQSFVPVMYSALVERGLPPTLLSDYCAARPARLHGLFPRKGTIAAGADCDLLVLEDGDFSFDQSTIVDEDDYRWSPYHGRRVRARVRATVLRGEIIFDGTTLNSRPGSGRFVARASS